MRVTFQAQGAGGASGQSPSDQIRADVEAEARWEDPGAHSIEHLVVPCVRRDELARGIGTQRREAGARST